MSSSNYYGADEGSDVYKDSDNVVKTHPAEVAKKAKEKKQEKKVEKLEKPEIRINRGISITSEQIDVLRNQGYTNQQIAEAIRDANKSLDERESLRTTQTIIKKDDEECSNCGEPATYRHNDEPLCADCHAEEIEDDDDDGDDEEDDDIECEFCGESATKSYNGNDVCIECYKKEKKDDDDDDYSSSDFDGLDFVFRVVQMMFFGALIFLPIFVFFSFGGLIFSEISSANVSDQSSAVMSNLTSALQNQTALFDLFPIFAAIVGVIFIFVVIWPMFRNSGVCCSLAYV